MNRIHSAVDAFLTRTGMNHRTLDMEKYCTVFMEEMRKGLTGSPSSLDMIPTYIDTSHDIPRDTKVIAMDAGGTNLRVALVSFDGSGKQVIEGLARHRMPGSQGEVSREEFFKALAGFAEPFSGKADTIGFCFSYPAEITPDKDGRLIYFSKEIRAPGVVGQMIGANLLAEMKGGRKPSRVILLNDTVATLLAGRNSLPGRRFDDYIGFVCGTGLNTAYVEANAEITKAPALDPKGSQIINTESGSFEKGPTGLVDEEFHATTINPGKYRNEKMISGAYQGGLALAALKRAARDGVLAAGAASGINALSTLTTKDLNDFLFFPEGDTPAARALSGASADDAQAAYMIADAIVERAAVMVAVNLCAVLLKTGKGTDPRRPVCITVDGTTFWQMRGFRTRVECAMRGFLTGDRERAFEIVRAAEDAPLAGAAIAALTN